jgi:hypothetical protein
MTIEQTVDIPPDHRLTIEVPKEIPTGRAILAFTLMPAMDRSTSSLRSMMGIDKGRDTMEAYFERHWAETAKEEENEHRQQGKLL